MAIRLLAKLVAFCTRLYPKSQRLKAEIEPFKHILCTKSGQMTEQPSRRVTTLLMLGMLRIAEIEDDYESEVNIIEGRLWR